MASRILQGDVFEQLNRLRSWKLERISPATFPHDIVVKLKYLTPKECDTIAAMIKTGTCYRCRIGKGRYFFGETSSAAIAAALNGQRKGRT